MHATGDVNDSAYNMSKNHETIHGCVNTILHACVLSLCVCVCLSSFVAPEKAPADGLGLTRWTLKNVNQYFKALGKRQLWLPKDRAIGSVSGTVNTSRKHGCTLF